jgi:mannose-6-phosphate isomerase-like protein (cupin superfamily)
MTSDTHTAGPVGQGEWLQTKPGERCLIRVAAAKTNGAYAVVDTLSQPGDSTPMHVHQNEDAHFLILEGTARVVCGNEAFETSAGTAITLPAVAADHFVQSIGARPVGRPIAGSSLVRRLVLAKDDPAKKRIRAWLSTIDDERLFRLGLTSEDIAALRGSASPPAEMAIAQGLDATSEAAAGYV